SPGLAGRVAAFGGAGFRDDDLKQARDFLCGALEEPARDNLGRRIFEARNFILIIMVEAGDDKPLGLLDGGKVGDPTDLFIKGPAHHKSGVETVAVKAAALVALGHAGKQVSSLKTEGLANLKIGV